MAKVQSSYGLQGTAVEIMIIATVTAILTQFTAFRFPAQQNMGMFLGIVKHVALP